MSSNTNGTRRRSHNSIKTSSRSKAKNKRKNRNSANNIKRIQSATQYQPKYIPNGHASKQYHHTHNASATLTFNGYNGLHNGYHQFHDEHHEDIDSPISTKPTHKKNAVSSFLSIFSGFSQSVRRSNSSPIDDTMTDLELLKRMKRRILDILSKMLGIY